MFNGIWRDLVYAGRSLAKARAFTLVCVVSLGIGMAPVPVVVSGPRRQGAGIALHMQSTAAPATLPNRRPMYTVDTSAEMTKQEMSRPVAELVAAYLD